LPDLNTQALARCQILGKIFSGPAPAVCVQQDGNLPDSKILFSIGITALSLDSQHSKHRQTGTQQRKPSWPDVARDLLGHAGCVYDTRAASSPLTETCDRTHFQCVCV